MFTTGSKLFIGATSLAIAALIVMGITNGGNIGWTATVGLVGAVVALLLLTGINFFARDSNVSSTDPASRTDAAAAQRAPASSIWPLFGAVGLGLLVVGAISTPIVFKTGVVVILAVMLEWMVQAWSERATSDPVYNQSLRSRLMHPLEFPVLGAVGLGIMIYSFSRIMLFVSKAGSPVVFGVIAIIVLLGGVLYAYSPGVKKSVAIGVCAIAGLGLVSTGAVMAIDGQRTIEPHEIIAKDSSICTSNDETEADKAASQNLAAKSNAAAIVTLRDGELLAHQLEIPGESDIITLPRSSTSNIVFVNEDSDAVRLTAHMGTFDTATIVNGKPTTSTTITCTPLANQGGRQLLTLIYPKSSRALKPGDAYTLSVPGNESAVITVVVP